MGEHEALKAAWPGVVEAMELIGSTQIQGRATMGGNLCNASPAADSVPALIAAGAVATVAGPELAGATCRSRRSPPGRARPRWPRARSWCPSAAQRPARSGDAYLRFIPRTEMDIAVVGAGINLTLDGGGTCSEARVALGAVAERALLVPEPRPP